MQRIPHVFSDFDPLELAGTRLLEVDDVVASWAVTVRIKLEHVSTQTLKIHFAQILEQFCAFGGLHRIAEPRASVA